MPTFFFSLNIHSVFKLTLHRLRRICLGQLNDQCLKATSVTGRSDGLQWESLSRELMVSGVLITESGADSDLMRDESVSGFVAAEPRLLSQHHSLISTGGSGQILFQSNSVVLGFNSAVLFLYISIFFWLLLSCRWNSLV